MTVTDGREMDGAADEDDALAAAVSVAPPRGRAWRWLARLGLLALVVGGAVAGARAWRKAHATVAPTGLRVRLGDVVVKAQATGRIVPRQELFVRPLVSGMLVELAVRPGDVVRRGAVLATVRILADPVALGDARAQVEVARARHARAARELERARAQSARDLIAAQALDLAVGDEAVSRAELTAALGRAQLIARGSAGGSALRSNRVLAPVDGTVLAVPVNVGDYVSETSGFRDGTTVAVVADMGDLLFKGQIEEAYVGQLQLGMPVAIRVGALPAESLRGTLQWISPRATIEQVGGAAAGGVQALTASSAGVTRFELWAAVARPPGAVRAGYSASAEVELARVTQVPVIEESALRFDGTQAYAQPCAGGPERRVTVGVSDGVRIQVTSGLSPGDCVRERQAR
ncbi:MAG: efflux RND transporter periplasmic adaptor subunit [Myxococcales bacterium]|nr:efflux RND transporter periplasmic adaptor subunit [Myxococcales bacterium]